MARVALLAVLGAAVCLAGSSRAAPIIEVLDGSDGNFTFSVVHTSTGGSDGQSGSILGNIDLGGAGGDWTVVGGIVPTYVAETDEQAHREAKAHLSWLRDHKSGVSALVEKRYNEPPSSFNRVVGGSPHIRQITISMIIFATALAITIFGSMLVIQAKGGDTQDHVRGDTSVSQDYDLGDHTMNDALDRQTHDEGLDDHAHEDNQ